MRNSDTALRILDLTFEDGPTQLATSEAILTAVGQGTAPPTLRLYSWSEPVVIIGVGQPASDLDLITARERGYRILRRIGGGTAVYHDQNEVSIDLIVPAGHPLGPTDVHAGYRLFAGLLEDALSRFGIETETVTVEMARSIVNDAVLRPICFASLSPYEFLHDNRKLTGLCQIRRRDAIAYQAAIYNVFDPEPLISSLVHDSSSVREQRHQKIDDFVTDMSSARGCDVDYRALQQALRDAAQVSLGAKIEEGRLSEAERQETARLVSEKYSNDEWTFRR